MKTLDQVAAKGKCSKRTIQYRVKALEMKPAQYIGNVPLFNADQVRKLSRRSK